MVFHAATLFKALRQSLQPRRFRLRHFLSLCVFAATMLVLLVPVRLLQLVDWLLFPGYRRTVVERPIYIVANPRSGTTFLHRLMALDDQFVFIKLWHTLLPSLLFYKLFDFWARVDRKIGSPGGKLEAWVNRALFGGWEGVHATGMNRAEEDEQYWMYTMLSPGWMLMLPFIGEFQEMQFVDRLPAKQRTRLTAYYRAALQRHMYGTDPGKRLLMKNALLAGRLHTCMAAVPDMQIVHLVRHPYEAIPSLLSMFSAPWKFHSPQAYGATDESRQLAQMGFDYYKVMLQLRKELPPDRYVEIRYDELVADPRGSVERVYEALGLEIGPVFRERLDAATAKARDYSSVHAYSLEEYGLTKDAIYEAMPEVFEVYGFER